MENIEKAKSIAKSFLMLALEPSDVPPVVFHPFFSTEVFFVGKELFIALEKPDEYAKYRMDFYNTHIEPAESIRDILHLVRKPYMLAYLKFLLDSKAITKKECGEMLGEVWTLIEINSHDKNATKRQILSWLAAADKERIMSADELAVYNALPDEVTVYRGCNKLADTKTFSWTIEK